MRGVKGIISLAVRSLRAIPENAIYVPMGYKVIPNGKIAYTDNIQHCTALLLCPKIIKSDYKFAFGHFEAFYDNGLAVNEVKSMVEELCDDGKVTVDDILAKTYSVYYSPSICTSFSLLSKKILLKIEDLF